ncbi:MAG: DUF2889 domain-containing protein [Pseudomonadota bacterium]
MPLSQPPTAKSCICAGSNAALPAQRRAVGHRRPYGRYASDRDRAFWRGQIAPGDPIHDMWVRLTIDDAMKVHDAEAVIDRHPYPPCPQAAPSLAAIKGHTIAPGWSMLVKRASRRRQELHHLMELLMPIATTAYQTMAPYRRAREQTAGAPTARPGKIDSCYSYSREREVVARFWPEFYEGP